MRTRIAQIKYYVGSCILLVYHSYTTIFDNVIWRDLPLLTSNIFKILYKIKTSG